jgi:hypothetical protein
MTEIMPVPRNSILLPYQQAAFGRAFFFPSCSEGGKLS